MPRNELFLKVQIGGRKIKVTKTYDPIYAREVFDIMGESSQGRLWQSLGIEDSYDPEEIPAPASPDRSDFLWEELSDAAHEDGNLRSFFVVTSWNTRK